MKIKLFTREHVSDEYMKNLVLKRLELKMT